ncbi:MAG: acyl-CoA dehydratase activase [Phycisphaerae bacterium]|nr:acyl-CoA dehydratase activase [Phycisphaerae bacterium]
MYIGIDIGSVSVNLVLMSADYGVLEDRYIRHKGRPLEVGLAALEDLLDRTPAEKIDGIALAGSGGKAFAQLLGLNFINEVVAQAKSTGALYPDVRTIIEIGGEDSKLILLDVDPASGRSRVKDFSMNALCAAGTGSFLDQQASRLGISIEREWGEMAMKSVHPPRIAGRCSVFAKTDMIHLQQEACPDFDIVAGLCFAMARNFKAVIGKGKQILPRVSFQGGVAANRGMVRAFTEVLGLKEGELLIPERHAMMGAIGAVMVAVEEGTISPLPDLAVIRRDLARQPAGAKDLHEQLEDDKYSIRTDTVPIPDGPAVEAFVGVDLGSISTNVVVIDEEGRVLARRYLMTAGRPIEVVTQGLYEVGLEIGDRVKVRGVGTTGSGRYLIADYIHADVVKNEITAHATGAISINPKVDTIFEIGGQDSKYVSIENSVVVDFTMNKVCAAGTGSFIEEQAERLNVGVKSGEFNRLALSAQKPPAMGERCTVFMETDINLNQQRGVKVPDLCAGLCYSIVQNYLNKVVEDHKVGDVIFFQGGTAYNRGIKAAFEKVLGKTVTVPPHHDIMGAIGVALIARDQWDGASPSRFKGFDIRDREYEVSSFECEDCPNNCEIRVVEVKGEEKLTYGSRCGKFDEVKKESLGAHLPRLFDERVKLLERSYPKNKPDMPNGKTVGIPRIAHFWELFPLWKGFFTELGYEVVLSDKTNRKLIGVGLQEISAETCFPIKVVNGHVLNALEKGVDYLLLPSIIDMPRDSDEIVNSYVCPYVQALPYTIKSDVDFSRWPDTQVLVPILHMSRGRDSVISVLDRLAQDLGAGRAERRRAIETALGAQDKFEADLKVRGKEVLSSIDPDEIALVIVSRPYNGCDPGLNLNIPGKLRDLGCLAIPLDMLPVDEEDISRDFPHMYWKYGQKILASARIIARDRRLYPVYITNFGCGPDSFIMKFFGRELDGKPCLTLEVDEHSADVGAITRCEAFLDSLKGVRASEARRTRKVVRAAKLDYTLSYHYPRTIYVPHMDDHGYMMAAAVRAGGARAEHLPMQNEEAIALARKYTTGKECYPCVVTVAGMLQKLMSPDFDRDHSAFFMPTAFGPCRFGQYNKFQRMLLDDLGYDDVPMILLDQDKDFHGDLKNLGRNFRRLTWVGFVYVDLLKKIRNQTRPYEVVSGTCDKLYAEFLRRGEEVIENHGDLAALGAETRRAFEAVEVDSSVAKPRIGVVGEIFIRCNAFANNFIKDKIEALGGEIVDATVQEWVNYTGWSRLRASRTERDVKRWITEKITGRVMRKEQKRIQAPFKGSIRHLFDDPPSDHVVGLGSRYLHPSVHGETILSMGRCLEYIEAGCSGIVNLHPFNCMPGTIVNSFLNRFQEEFDIPVLKVAFDGLEQATEMTRIEAFMYQCRQKAEANLAAQSDAH